MTQDETPAARTPPDFYRILTGAWSATGLEESLKVIAQGVCDVAGFGVSALSVLRDSGQLETVAVAGDPGAEELLLGTYRLLAELEKDVADAQEWGSLLFVPHEAVIGREDDLGWVADFEPLDDPDAWQPLDLLFALLHDNEGNLVGVLSVDMPVDGLRPEAERQRLLTRYAVQASHAVAALLERDRAADQVRLSTATRNIVRVASGQLSLDQLLATVQPEIVSGFRAEGMWLQAFDNFGRGHDAIYSTDDREVVLPPALVAVAHGLAERSWAMSATPVISRQLPWPAHLHDNARQLALDFLESINVVTALLIPLGVGEECLGMLVLVRNPGSPEWTRTETEGAQDLGRDLGRAIFNARTFERERQLLEEVSALESYKSQLIATVSHEFKNPLTGLLGHLELIEDSDVSPDVRRSLNVIARSALKLEALAQDLLLFSRAADPHRTVECVPVDLGAIIEDYLEINALEAARRNLKITLEAEDRVFASGETSELERVCVNLISNAVKYSRDGGEIRIGLQVLDSRVLLRVADDGLGISEDDQANLFSEFFRSTNPEALHQPGTGLGLAIVQRIVHRHGGTIEVRSELGVGTTFTVALPRSPRQP